MSITLEQIEQNKVNAKLRKDALAAQKKQVQELFLAPYRAAVAEKAALAENVQFYHDQYAQTTFAVVPPSLDELKVASLKLLGGGKEVGLILNVGISSVNTKTDTYDRKIGRLVSTSRLSPIFMKLEAAVVKDGRATFHLQLDNLSVTLLSETNDKPPMLIDVSTL